MTVKLVTRHQRSAMPPLSVSFSFHSLVEFLLVIEQNSTDLLQRRPLLIILPHLARGFCRFVFVFTFPTINFADH